MKNFYLNNMKQIFTASLVALFVFAGCERSLDGLEEPTLSQDPVVFSEGFNGMGSDFYFPFLGARPDVFSVDENVGFESNSSIRFDVPNSNDPAGNFAGAIFRIDGSGRDLSGYDALTFYARSSQGVNIGEFGFGQDFEENEFLVTRTAVTLGTNWEKVVIPIPDPSQLTDERGVFWFSAGTQETGGFGYSFWIDDLQFERLGSFGQVRPTILGAAQSNLTSFVGSSTTLTGLNYTVNYVPEGEAPAQDITVVAAPSYFDFTSSDASVATVSDLGVVSVVGSGSATITATLSGNAAVGSLEVTSLGELAASPDPAQNAADVKSIFSDAYTDETGSNFNPAFGGSTTQTDVLTTSNGTVLNYTNNNFTGIIFNSTVDATDLSFMHVDVYVQDPGVSVGIQIRDIGDNGVINTNIFNGNPEVDDADYRQTLSGLTVGQWTQFEIPLAGNITNQKDNLGAIIITGGPNFILDNIYFY